MSGRPADREEEAAILAVDAIKGVNDTLTFFVTSAAIVGGIVAFLRRARNGGIDKWDYLLIMGMMSVAAIWLFVFLRSRS